jgi:hypothetical protein
MKSKTLTPEQVRGVIEWKLRKFKRALYRAAPEPLRSYFLITTLAEACGLDFDGLFQVVIQMMPDDKQEAGNGD